MFIYSYCKFFQTIDNKVESRLHETSYMESKYINWSTARDSDVKNEIISNQHNVDTDNKECLFETVICVTSKQVNT